MKYLVPAEGLKAAKQAGEEYLRDNQSSEVYLLYEVLEAFIRWQSENPQVPTTEWLDEFNRVGEIKPFKDFRGAMIAAWIGRMYLAEPEPEVPEIEDILRKYYGHGSSTGENLRKDFVEVFRRGKMSTKKLSDI